MLLCCSLSAEQQLKRWCTHALTSTNKRTWACVLSVKAFEHLCNNNDTKDDTKTTKIDCDEYNHRRAANAAAAFTFHTLTYAIFAKVMSTGSHVAIVHDFKTNRTAELILASTGEQCSGGGLVTTKNQLNIDQTTKKYKYKQSITSNDAGVHTNSDFNGIDRDKSASSSTSMEAIEVCNR